MFLWHPRFCLSLPAALALALTTLVVAVPGSPAKAQNQAQWNSLYDRIIRLEAAVRNMQGQAFGQQRAQPQNPQSAARMALRIGTLEDQMRRLLSTIESLTHQVRGLNTQLQQARQNNEFRFRQLEQAAREGRLRGKLKRFADAGTTNTQRPTTLAPIPDAGVTNHAGGLPVYDQSALDNLVVDDEELIFESGPVTDNTDPDPNLSTNPSFNTGTRQPAPGPTTLGTITLNQSGQVTGGSVGAQPGSNATINPNAVEKLTLDGQKVARLDPSGGGPELLYEQAFDNLQGRKLKAAQAGFEQFLTKYKRHKFAAKAQYWLGETHYARKKYSTAARAFLKGYKGYKKSSMAPQSLVKLGMSLRRMGQKESACATFEQVRSEFPKAKAVRKLARKESRRAGC